MFLKPQFFIIGERKCGTSSLYRYLITHPNVLPCKQKEPQFFTKKPWHVWWNIKKYYALFPHADGEEGIIINWPELDENGMLYQEQLEFERQPNQNYITGEASANTFYKASPRVVKHFLPEVKLILMLRNPVERAFSHYRMLERFEQEGRKVLPLSGFSIDMYREMDRVQKGKKGNFISPGLYIQRLPNWIKVFGKENIFVIRTEDMQKTKKAAKIMKELELFLGLREWSYTSVLQNRYNQAPPSEIPWDVRRDLHFFYKPYNLALEDLLGRKMEWE